MDLQVSSRDNLETILTQWRFNNMKFLFGGSWLKGVDAILIV